MQELRIIDIGEATSLLVNGERMIRLEGTFNKRNSPIKIFVFEATDRAKEISRMYRSQDLLVDAFNFYRATRDLKNRIAEHNRIMLQPH